MYRIERISRACRFFENTSSNFFKRVNLLSLSFLRNVEYLHICGSSKADMKRNDVACAWNFSHVCKIHDWVVFIGKLWDSLYHIGNTVNIIILGSWKACILLLRFAVNDTDKILNQRAPSQEFWRCEGSLFENSLNACRRWRKKTWVSTIVKNCQRLRNKHSIKFLVLINFEVWQIN